MTVKEMAKQSGVDYAKIRTVMMKYGYYQSRRNGPQDYDPKKVKDMLIREMRERIERLIKQVDSAMEELDMVIDWEAVRQPAERPDYVLERPDYVPKAGE